MEFGPNFINPDYMNKSRSCPVPDFIQFDVQVQILSTKSGSASESTNIVQ